jgi:hypothetical protein
MLQGIILLIGIMFNILGLIVSSQKKLPKNSYDDSGFWFGTNDGTKLNKLKTKVYDSTTKKLTIIGITISLLTLLCPPDIILCKATINNFLKILTFMIPTVLLLNYFINNKCRNLIDLEINRYINNKFAGGSIQRLSVIDAVRYINYISLVKFDEMNSIESIKGKLVELYNIEKINDIEFYYSSKLT